MIWWRTQFQFEMTAKKRGKCNSSRKEDTITVSYLGAVRRKRWHSSLPHSPHGHTSQTKINGHELYQRDFICYVTCRNTSNDVPHARFVSVFSETQSTSETAQFLFSKTVFQVFNNSVKRNVLENDCDTTSARIGQEPIGYCAEKPIVYL